MKAGGDMDDNEQWISTTPNQVKMANESLEDARANELILTDRRGSGPFSTQGGGRHLPSSWRDKE